MSFYATVGGELSYSNRQSFEKAVDTLQWGGWLHDDNFVDECGDVITEDRHNADTQNLSIEIPVCHYRNLTRILDTIFENATGEVVWTSTDGCFSGGVIVNGEEKCFDLEVWNKETGGEEPPDEDDVEGLIEWQQEIEQDFFDEFYAK